MIPTSGTSSFISAPCLNHFTTPPPLSAEADGAAELPKKGMTEDGAAQEWDAAWSVMSAPLTSSGRWRR